ncbi:DUF6479 family protein [Streptomyces sp. NPDC048416]|uniref:DUF6479 family protein n=1 Tax=Streptomyces sp. NPDC048416 TaxID=3365546 RepID=UPI00371AB020
MTCLSMQLALDHGLVIGVVPLAVGVVLVALLIGAVWWGRRRQARRAAPPRPGEQPRLPESGPVGEVRERREPAEVPRSDHRLTPHQLPGFGNQGTRRAEDQAPPDEGQSGAFGSGGPSA